MRILTARLISILLNPLIILIILPFFLVYRTTNNFSSAFFWTNYTLVFLIAIAVFIFVAVRRKIFTNWDVSNREQRPLLFFMFLVLGIIYMLGLFLFHAPRIIFVVTISILLGVMVLSIINKKIKASIHVATIAALVLGLAIGYGGYYYFLLLTIPIMGWARVILNRHTVTDVIVGGILGCVLLLSVYGFYQNFMK